MRNRLIAILLLTSITATSIFAQDEEEKEKIPFKEKLFTGGTLTVSFYTGGSILGGNPMLGYTLAKWADAGIVFNYIYAGSRDNIRLNDKLRQHVYGPGIFIRLYPARFVFIQAQPEHNFTSVNYTDPQGIKFKEKTEATSFLVGAGMAQGRLPGSNSFYYISLLFDVIKDKNSPYVKNIYDQTTGQLIRTDAIPIIRAGLNIGLFQGRK